MAPSSWKGKDWWSNPYKPLSLLGKGGGRVTMVRYRLSLPTQWMGGGGGGLAHLPSFLFSDREGLEISSIHTPSSSEKGESVREAWSLLPEKRKGEGDVWP